MRDTSESFAAVAADVLRDPPDVFVVTGDIANEGKADEYELAGTALAELGVPVYCLPGNHDFVDPLHAHLPRPGVVVQRSMRIGEWLFLFGDTNKDGVRFDPTDGWIDLPDRAHRANGGIHSHELAWLRRQLDVGSAAHAMLWVHHPPSSPGMFARPEYDAQFAAFAGSTTPLRAVSAGHLHTGVERTVAEVPLYLCPSTGLCLDFEESRSSCRPATGVSSFIPTAESIPRWCGSTTSVGTSAGSCPNSLSSISPARSARRIAGAHGRDGVDGRLIRLSRRNQDGPSMASGRRASRSRSGGRARGHRRSRATGV